MSFIAEPWDKPKIATKPIRCFEAFTRPRGYRKSAFEDIRGYWFHKFDFDKPREARFSPCPRKDGWWGYTVDGLLSFENKEEAFRLANTPLMTTDTNEATVYECEIPMGAMYYRVAYYNGTAFASIHALCSDKLRIVKRLHQQANTIHTKQ